jgi:hypothetical protein
MSKRTAALVVPVVGLFCLVAATLPVSAQGQVTPQVATPQPAIAQPAIAPAAIAQPAILQPAIAQPAVAQPVLAPATSGLAATPQAVRPVTGQVKPAAPTPVAAPARVVEPVQEGQVDRAPASRPADKAEAANVRIEVTITYQVGNAAPVKRSAMLTVADLETGSLRAGNQVAVPSTTTYAPAAKTEAVVASAALAPTPVTSFNYRSVGLNLDARRVYVSGNRAKLQLSVEFSAIEDKAGDSGRPPAFPTFSQNFGLVVDSGKPIVVAQSSDIVDGVERKQSVEVKATILR